MALTFGQAGRVGLLIFSALNLTDTLVEKRDGRGGCAKETLGHLQGPSLDGRLFHASWASHSTSRPRAGMNKANGRGVGGGAKILTAAAKLT